MTRVLIVDDHPDIRALIRLALENESCEVLEAGTGDEGLAAARRHAPDVVLLDLMMPGVIDGYETCRRIRVDPALKHTRVVMLTARSGDADRERGLASGAHAYLIKPFSPLYLSRLVAEMGRAAAADRQALAAQP